MYRYKKPEKSMIKRNESVTGETLEEKIRRIVNNKEPITDGAPTYYTERSEGVKPETNIRTDKWDIAIEAMSTVDKIHKDKRKARQDLKLGKIAKEGMDKEKETDNDGKPKPTDTTNPE